MTDRPANRPDYPPSPLGKRVLSGTAEPTPQPPVERGDLWLYLPANDVETTELRVWDGDAWRPLHDLERRPPDDGAHT